MEQILRIAVADSVRNENLRRSLNMAAEELGLSEDQVRTAEAKWKHEKKVREDLGEFMAEQKPWFWVHFTAYAILSVYWIFMNITDWHGTPWAIFPVGGWGIGVIAMLKA